MVDLRLIIKKVDKTEKYILLVVLIFYIFAFEL